MTARTISFEEIVREQSRAFAGALAAEASSVGASLPAGLAERLGVGAVAGTALVEDSRRLRDAFGGRPPLALVAFDTPGVHDYVFRVRRPVDIAGGSHLVAALTDSERGGGAPMKSVEDILAAMDLPRGALVFAGGGRGLALVPAHRAAELRQQIEQVLVKETQGDLASVTAELAVWPADVDTAPGPGGAGQEPASHYAAAVSVLMGRLARERSRRESFGETVAPGARRCAACRRRVATEERHAVREWICSPCARRRAVGGRLKGVDNEARTFEELASRGDREGRSRLAVLYADGANAGAAFQAIDTMARHRTLSEAVEDAFDQAVQGILDQAALQDAGERLLCQKPIRGGDDAVLILPARFAFDAATRIIASVEDTFDRQRNPLLRSAFRDAPPGLISCVDGFGVGVGVVIADCHFPVGFLVRYAEELLRSAKGRMHDDRDSAAGLPRVAKGAVDFLVLASGRPLSESISQLRRTHLRIAPRGREPGLYLTERPYRFDDFQRFLADAKALAAVNRSQLFAVRQEVLRGYAVSRSLWRYQHARAREGASGWAGYRAARGAALDEVDGLLWREARPPAQIGGAWMSTSFLDAIEILGALPEAERSGEAAP